MTSPYDKRTEKTRVRLMKGRTFYVVNKIYQAEGDVLFYINSRGWFHVITCRGVKYNGQVHYELVDLLLTKEDKLRETKHWGFYKSLLECVAALKEML